MKFLFEFFPIIVFFTVYKFFDIFTATAAVIVVSAIQITAYWIKFRRTEVMLLTTALLAIIMGSITLLLHEEIYIKWKPTVIYWFLAVFFLASQYVGGKALIQRVMESNMQLPQLIWTRLNLMWVSFFVLMGAINLYVVYNYSTDTWVNFKLMGIIGFTIAFVIIQSIYLARHIQDEPNNLSKSLDKNLDKGDK